MTRPFVLFVFDHEARVVNKTLVLKKVALVGRGILSLSCGQFHKSFISTSLLTVCAKMFPKSAKTIKVEISFLFVCLFFY